MNQSSNLHAAADIAPNELIVTAYDQAHFLTYARVLDAEHDGLDWAAGLKSILYRDFGDDVGAGKTCWDSHVGRAHWIVKSGIAIMLTDAKSPLQVIP
jgi:hypothetical protein